MSRPVDEIAGAYDRWAGTYETNENATRDMAARVIRRRFADARDGDVLEIGCGTGLNTRHLAERSRSVLAFDFSAGMLERARANVSGANVRFEQRDIRRGWPLADDAVDLVVCTLVLEHVEDLGHVFGEAARVLRPGGEFFVCELHPFRQLQGGQAQFTEHDSGRVVLVPAFLHDVSDYLNAGARHGFELLRADEWRDDEGAAKTSPPRLLSLHVRLAAKKFGL
ncbi:MAG TPA: methyltransferase domain-containing protein [Pyrinomonadaceae bacterium]|nr:methyltransferase domain-containing protein [Pyrinomonadaceae bacterium]